MGIVAICPNGHRIKVKDELAGRKGVCPTCAARFRIPRKEAPADADPSREVNASLPTARAVSLDPVVVATLPAATPLDDAAPAHGRGAEVTDDQPDFVAVADDPAPAVPRRLHPALAERPESPWLIAVRGGTPSAPLDAAALGEWLESGAATAEHVVWREGWAEWRPLLDVFPGVIQPDWTGGT